MAKNSASQYIRDNFEPSDRLALVLLSKGTGEAVQRLATADRIAAEPFQSWLRHRNAQRCEVYISMNNLHADARGRTRIIEVIRHIYLDFDPIGTTAVEVLTKRTDIPPPNYLIHTSPDKWQAIWKVTAFDRDQAEILQRALAHDTGADIAATDSARVMRLLHFYHHKYPDPHYIRHDHRATEIYTPDRFPQILIRRPHHPLIDSAAALRTRRQIPVRIRLGLRPPRHRQIPPGRKTRCPILRRTHRPQSCPNPRNTA